MEISIGIRDASAPISLDVALSEEELIAVVNEALDAQKSLKLEGTDGTTLLIPSRSLGYVRIAKEDQRRVGFGFI